MHWHSANCLLRVKYQYEVSVTGKSRQGKQERRGDMGCQLGELQRYHHKCKGSYLLSKVRSLFLFLYVDELSGFLRQIRSDFPWSYAIFA